MRVITNAESWGIVQRLNAKAPTLLKPLASHLGLEHPAISGTVVRFIWDCFRDADFGRDHYPYSQELIDLTACVNRNCGVVLEPWHSWAILCRAHKMSKNHRSRRGQWSPYLKSLHKEYGVSVLQMRVMGYVPMKLSRGMGDDVAMTHVITMATNELFAYGHWGDWFDDRFTFNAMLSCRKSGAGVPV